MFFRLPRTRYNENMHSKVESTTDTRKRARMDASTPTPSSSKILGKRAANSEDEVNDTVTNPHSPQNDFAGHPVCMCLLHLPFFQLSVRKPSTTAQCFAFVGAEPESDGFTAAMDLLLATRAASNKEVKLAQALV